MQEENQDEKTGLRNMLSLAKQYANVRTEIVRLNIAEKVAKALAAGITGAGVAIFYLLAFIFASFSLCYWLGKVLKSTELGFLCSAGLFLIIGIMIHFISHAKLRAVLTDKFIDEFTNDDDDKEFEENE